ncbi:MAG: family 16 glycoside hydrolase [Chitinophagaceae bacterium]|nr:family 16 glycoside hydrolase [Chitinophagaceae bacterium]
MKNFILAFSAVLFLISLQAQSVKLLKSNLVANQVYMSFEKLDEKNVLRVIKDSTVQKVDEPTFVKVKDLDFENGIIEVKVLSRLLKNAPAFARGFIGIAFRIDDNNTKYESIYIRPTNGRADDQVRRNHSVQYYSYPDYKFDRLRKETPETYETYADMGLNEWITMRIEVKGKEAKLYLNNQKQASFIVSEMKGSAAKGGIGLWVDIGTEGYFKDLKVIHK